MRIVLGEIRYFGAKIHIYFIMNVARKMRLWVIFKHCCLRLKKRALNKIVYPSMVANSISVPSILLFMSLRNFYSPMKSVIGQNGCYIYMVINFWRWEFYQFHSFFIALFRYTILFHPHFLATFKLDPNVSFLITETFWSIFKHWQNISEIGLLD